MRTLLLTLMIFAMCTNARSQGNVGIGTGSPNASAQLDISSGNKGILIPRVALTANTDVTTIASPVTSLLVYNTATAGLGATAVSPGYYYWNGSVWARMLVQIGVKTAWMTQGNEETTGPAVPATYGTSTIEASKNWIGTTDAQPFTIATNSIERMRITSDGLAGIGTASPAANTLLSISPYSNIYRNGILMNFPGSGTISSTAYGLDVNVTANQNVRGYRYVNTTSGNGVFWGTGSELNAGAIVSGYTGYRNTSGLSFGVYGINGTNSAYATNANAWAAFLQGRTVISSESSPTSGLGTDLEIRNTSTGSNPVTLSLRQTNSNSTAATTLANINFGDNYQIAPQAQLRVIRQNASSGIADLPTAFGFWTNMDASSTMVERMRIGAATNNTSEVWVNAISPYSGDILSATSNLTGDYGVNGYNTLTSAAAGGGVYGESRSANTFGVWGYNTNATGTGNVGSGNGLTSSILVNGSGGAFTGLTTGVYAYNTSLSTAQAIYSNNGGTICRVNYWNGTQYKILGTGTVSTTAEGLNGNRVVLHAPETPEIYFQDYGNGKLINGKAHIDIDPILSKNITVNELHPLQVFIQLNGDCKGVYVSNRTSTGFDVIELQGGTSNIDFTWSITANRSDEVLSNGNISKNADVRFEAAPIDLPEKVLPKKRISAGYQN